MAPTDNELVVRCLQQDEYAWQLLVERHSHRVLNIAFQFTGRREEAEDLAQEIFLRVYRSLRRFDLGTSFLPWLVRVSRNLCIDEYRSRAREKASLLGEEPDPERTPDHRPGPLRELEEKEPADWDESARPHLENFLTLHTPYAGTLPQSREPTEEEIALALTRRGKPTWMEEDFKGLLTTLGCAGYGWLRPEGLRRELERMAKERR